MSEIDVHDATPEEPAAPELPETVPDDVDPADSIEQALVVPTDDDDDYR